MTAADEVRRLAEQHGVAVALPPGDHGFHNDPVLWALGTLWARGQVTTPQAEDLMRRHLEERDAGEAIEPS